MVGCGFSGHLARIRGELDRPAAEAMLRRLAADRDAEVRAAVRDALGDLSIFLYWRPGIVADDGNAHG